MELNILKPKYQLVYELYELTEEEINIVEGSEMMNDLIQEINYDNWWDFTSQSFSNESIFRGHSNYSPEEDERGNEIEFKKWKTQSAFRRQFPDVEFWMYYPNYLALLDNIDLYKETLVNFIDKENYKNLSVLQILHLFQHYGIATPLIDFTKNVDIALYFAYSGLLDQATKRFLGKNDERKITIVELKLDVLRNQSVIKEIGDDAFKKRHDLEYRDFYFYAPKNSLKNENLIRQKGVFVY